MARCERSGKGGGVVVTYLRLRGHRRCFLTLCRQEDQRLVSWGTLNAGSLKFERGQGSFGGEKFAIRQMTTDFFFFFFLGSLTLPSRDIIGIQVYSYLCPIFNVLYYMSFLFQGSYILIFYIYELIDI